MQYEIIEYLKVIWPKWVSSKNIIQALNGNQRGTKAQLQKLCRFGMIERKWVGKIPSRKCYFRYKNKKL